MKIEVLFPEICNLYGDLANVEYLKLCDESLEVVETSIKEEPLFLKEKPAMIFLGSMSEASQEMVIDKLMPYKERIEQLIEEGVVFLATGNALEIFGKTIENEDGTKIDCLGIFDTVAKRRMFNRFNSLYLGSYGNIEIVGFKSQFTHSYGKYEPLFDTKRGPGLNPDVKGEGLRKVNFMATYVLGPTLILNPLFTLEVMKLMGIKEPRLAHEKAIMECYQVRLEEFSQPERGFYY